MQHRSRALLLVVAGVAMVSCAWFLPTQALVAQTTLLAERGGALGPELFAVLFTVACVLLVPVSALTIAAGALFSFPIALLVALVASNLAAALAFLIARHAARGAIGRIAQRSRRFCALDGAIRSGGWKVVALIRLSPGAPFSALNYFFGLTTVKFWTCVATTLWATLPGLFLHLFIGHAGMAGLLDLHRGHPHPPWQWALLLLGLAVTTTIILYLARLARQHLPEKVVA